MAYQQSKLVDEYIDHFDGEVRVRLETLRRAVQTTFPNLVEDISYQMPTYRPAPKKRGLIHFAASKHHIGIYAIFDPESNTPMYEKMKPYRTGKGTLQFANDEPFPVTIIEQILQFHLTHLKNTGLYK